MGKRRALGGKVRANEVGNVFTIRLGAAKDRRLIVLGSHMGTQHAGMLDGTKMILDVE